MENNKVKILIACHKPDNVYKDDVYMPIYVGRAISPFKEEMKDMIGDDTGDNISDKNPNYCELTAQYWAWKNLECQYIGLCHYRRYFEKKITVDNIDHILGDKYDVLCINKIYDVNSTANRLITATSLDDFQIFLFALNKISPEMFDYTIKFLGEGVVTPYNMFVMKKSLFNEFAKWQFSILQEMENYVKLSGYSRARRIYGYYSEMLLPIYLGFFNKKVRYSPCVSMIGEHAKKSLFSFFYMKYTQIVRNLVGKEIPYNINAVITGFVNDGINVGYIKK